MTTSAESATAMKAIAVLATGKFPCVNADCIVKYRTSPVIELYGQH